MRDFKLFPSVQSLTENDLSRHLGIDFNPTKSTTVGKISINSTGSSTVALPVSVAFLFIVKYVVSGIRMINGTLTATSKLLYFDHSPCSPKDQPVIGH